MSRIALVSTLGLAGFTAIASITLLTAGPGEQTESALYALAFAVVLPAAIAGGVRMARALGGALPAVTALLAAGLLAILVPARLVYAVDGAAGVDSPLFLAAVAAWVAFAAVVVRAGASATPPAWLERVAQLPASQLVAVPAVLLGALLIGFAPPPQLDAPSLAAAAGLAALGIAAYLALLRRRLPRGAGIAVDAAVVLAVVLIGNDLSVYDEADRFFARTSEVHQNFYLGTANDVLHGRAMLVDTFSQYGVGIFYFLAGWFLLTDIGYGAMTLLSGLMSAAQVLAGYAILRLAGASRPLSAIATAAVTVAIFFAGSLFPPTSHPSLGGLRYLLPYLVVAAVLWADRRDAPPRRWAPVALVAIASLWSIETFAYCAAAFAGMSAFAAFAASEGWRQAAGALGRRLAPAVGAAAAVQLLFALATRVLAGDWPQWGGYVSFLGSYDVEGISAAPMQAWSPGLLICAIYFASAVAIVLILARTGPPSAEDRPALLAVSGLVPVGLAVFPYFVGNSQPDVALVVGVPALLCVALWLILLERRRDTLSRGVVIATLAPVFMAVAVLALFVRPTVSERWPDTPAAMLLEGTAPDRLGRMLRSEPLTDRVSGAERLLDRHFPGDGPALVMAEQEHTVTTLVQAGRVNRLPVSHFLQDGLVMDRAWPRVEHELDRLRSGDLLLTEPVALEPDPPFPAPLLQRTAAEVQRRFDLRVVDRDGGFMVVRLTPRGR